VQQLREDFLFGLAPRFLIFDRDRKYGVEVPAAARSLGIEATQPSFESPWQNGVAERWIESCRRKLLDHIIAVNERHLRRLLFDDVRYHHEDRTHLGRGKGTPAGRICSTNAAALFLTIDSVDCIIDTTGLPELMLLTPRRHGLPRPQYVESHRFAACWNERPKYVASSLPTQFGLRPAIFIRKSYPAFRRD